MFWIWCGFVVFVLLLLALDLGVFHRKDHVIKTREALATIRELVDLDPENVATRIKLAELYSKESMVKEAVNATAGTVRPPGRSRSRVISS